MHSVIKSITDKIQKRSQDSRASYLEIISISKNKSPNRDAISCSNLAHTYAACGKHNSEQFKKPMVGIISAYNDMLSAHAPFEGCLLYTSPSPRDKRQSRMPSSA